LPSGGGLFSFCRLTYAGWQGSERMLLLPFERRYVALTASIVAAAASLVLAQLWPSFWLLFVHAAVLSRAALEVA
jgi:hypothetical protein